MKKTFLNKTIFFLLNCIISIVIFSCTKEGDEPLGDTQGKGILILNQGQMSKANASLSFYNYETKKVTNNLFYNANSIPLGDIAQSIYDDNNSLFIMLTNSRKIIEVNKKDFKQINAIAPQSMNEPRYMAKYRGKFYVSNYKGYNILVFDSNMSLINTINTILDGTKKHAPNFIIKENNKLFAACDFEDNTILVINTEKDAIEASINVGISPAEMVIDKNGSLWVLCTGGYDGHPLGKESPSLYKINTSSYEIEERIIMPNKIKYASNLTINSVKDTLYFLDGDEKNVMQMPIASKNQLGISTLIKAKDIKSLYGLFILDSDIYLTDAVDYVSNGFLFRYSKNGNLLDSVQLGINPSFIIKK